MSASTHKKCLHILLLIFLLAFSQSAAAQESKGRDVLIKESIANLDSNDVHVAAQAARNLGYLQATEGVPAMFRVLQSSRFLSLSEHIMATDKNSVSDWVVTDVRGEIINSLGLIGDKRAVPVLKRYLKKPPKNSYMFTGNAAYTLYQITGKSYKYKDRDGRMKLFQKSVSKNVPANYDTHPITNGADFYCSLQDGSNPAFHSLVSLLKFQN